MDQPVNKKRVLVVYFSQTGQLTSVLESMLQPLQQSEQFEVVLECLKPVTAFPFPWPFLKFFDTFPETVYDEPIAIEPLSENAQTDFDLIILGYQVWYLSPSQPVTAFLQSEQAARLLYNKPVVTVIACRNMWLMAQEKVRQHLQRLDARLIDNVVLTDPAHVAATFISTPLWMLTGIKGPLLNGLIPAAGVSPGDVANAKRFGDAIAQQLPLRQADSSEPMLRGLGAVEINERMIASEKIATRSFKIWGRLLRAVGQPGQFLRRAILVFYIVFLIVLICTVVPLSALIKRLLKPLMQSRIDVQREYYSSPSGEGRELVDQG